MRLISASRRRHGHSFGKNSHHAGVLSGARLPPDDVVVQGGFDIPSLLLRHLGKMFAAVQSLLFSRDGQENNRCRKFLLQLAQDARALEADGGSAGIVICAGRRIGDIESVAIARVVVAGYEHDAICLFRIGAPQHRINIGDFRRFRNAFGGLLGEGVSLYLEAAAAFFGVALKFAT